MVAGFFSTAFVDYGYYETMQDLVKATNKAPKAEIHNDNIKLTFNAVTGKVTVQLKSGYQLILTGRMSIILGFGGKEVKITKTTVSPYMADLFDMSTIYIYSDVVHPQIVGDTNAKLLRSIPV